MQDNLEILNLKEVSCYLHCSISLLRKLIYENEISYLEYYFKKEILDKWIVSKYNDIEIGGFDNDIRRNRTKI